MKIGKNIQMLSEKIKSILSRPKMEKIITIPFLFFLQIISYATLRDFSFSPQENNCHLIFPLKVIIMINFLILAVI